MQSPPETGVSAMMPWRRILVTNDDGIDAPGLQVATAIAAELAAEVWVVAPQQDRSGVGQSISLGTPLRARACGHRRYAINGTPADCVMYALGEWLAEQPPDLVLSGVNCGANYSDAVMYSGTVGAALAAAHLGLPAVALSQVFHDREAIDYAPARHLAAALVRRLLQAPQRHACWNINFPDRAVEAITTAHVTRQCSGGMRWPRLQPGVDGRGLAYRWLAFERGAPAAALPQSDMAAVDAGCVSLMPLRTSRCDEDCVEAWAHAPALALDAAATSQHNVG